MKKLLIVFLMMIFPMLGISQTSQHMKFLGIPMQGTAEQFGNKLLDKGFVWTEKSPYFMMMKGRVAGNYGNLEINDGYEYEVGVWWVEFTYECFSRAEGEEKLMQYKNILDSKYTCTEKLSRHYTYKCQYGKIELDALVKVYADGSLASYKIIITYFDKKNVELYNYRQKNGLGKNSNL